MRILITGINGFVGSNLVKALCEKHELYGLDINDTLQEGVCKVYSWNDLGSGKIQGMDAIIHLAGKAHDTQKKSDAEVYFKVNTGLTKTIYDYFLKSSTRKFIFFSSVKAATNSVAPGIVLDENVTPNPVGAYGESKIKAEEYLKEHWDVQDKTTVILRPCMIHGPGNKGNLNLLYNVVSKGVPWPLGAFDNKRTFTSVDNLCFVIDRILTKDIDTGIYNMGDDETLSTNELISCICSTLDKKERIWHLPKALMRSAAKIGSLLHLPLDEERLKKLTEDYIVSNHKIKTALEIDRLPIRAHDGLKKTIESFAHKSE